MRRIEESDSESESDDGNEDKNEENKGRTMVKRLKYFYCGDKTTVPEGYCTFGSRYKCLKRGFGVALYKGKPTRASDSELVICPNDAIKTECSSKQLTDYQKFIKKEYDNVRRKLERQGTYTPSSCTFGNRKNVEKS